MQGIFQAYAYLRFLKTVYMTIRNKHISTMEVSFMYNMTMKQRIAAQWEAYGKMLLRADLA